MVSIRKNSESSQSMDSDLSAIDELSIQSSVFLLRTPEGLRARVGKFLKKIKSIFDKNTEPETRINAKLLADRMASAAYTESLLPHVAISYSPLEANVNEPVKLWSLADSQPPRKPTHRVCIEPNSILRRLNGRIVVVEKSPEELLATPAPVPYCGSPVNREELRVTPTDGYYFTLAGYNPYGSPWGYEKLSPAGHRRVAKALIRERAEFENKNVFSAHDFNEKYRQLMHEAINESDDGISENVDVAIKQKPVAHELDNVEEDLVPSTHATDSYPRETSGASEESAYSDDEPSVVIYRLVQNAPRQVITLISGFQQMWYDERLQWNSTFFDGIDHIFVQRSKVWVPDICPLDSVEMYDTRPEFKQTSGVRHFPYDVQMCTLKLVTYTFDQTEAHVVGTVFDDLSLKDATRYDYIIQRNALYYIALIIVPSFVQTLLCVAGIFSSVIQDVDVDKFAMGLTAITSTSVMISIVADSIPKTKATPMLTNYVTFNLTIIAAANIAVIIQPRIRQLLRWIRRSWNRKSQCSDKWVQFFLNSILLFFFEGLVIYNFTSMLIDGAASGQKRIEELMRSLPPPEQLPEFFSK
ncbi:unnamed protein product [Caenorhabditis auriculariae]|uniref:Neurotransmitter-gated ion-channel ligand-binding domain-containing protein n=1 Tax=Caenorhabditis auriculariae TaxID=2777116 RepID=A0A8S1GWT6_9PELO|nr:unnamed protein product [Caenorhabditis auriculariae]